MQPPADKGLSSSEPVPIDDRPSSTDGAAPANPHDATIPQSTEAERHASEYSQIRGPYHVSGYRTLHKLGEGTYGVVYLAEQENTGIQVAIKFFAHRVGDHWQMLVDEVKRLAQLQGDPGIVQLLDVNADANPPYYIMRYAEGGSLAERLKTEKTIPLPEALPLFRRVSEALAYVHAKGIRHCDLKPGNILLDVRGQPLLADFGQAHLASDASPALGTFFYMAPEQADLSRPIPDTRWDVYGLGAVFYATLTGHPPREDPALLNELGNTTELGHRLRRYRESIHRAPPPREHHRLPGMDRPLAEIIDRCLVIDPDKRWHDAGAVLSALQRRDRQLRMKALRVFGLVTPAVLALLLLILGLVAERVAVAESKDALITQLEQSDRVTAQLIANMAEQEIDWRRRKLLDGAKDPRLRHLLASRPSHQAAAAWLQDFVRDQAIRANTFIFLSIVDADGRMWANWNTQRGKQGAEETDLLASTGKKWAWREWYNGVRHYFDRKNASIPPVRRPHVSEPYRGAGDVSQPLLITLSIPVMAPGQSEEVVGLLTGSIEIGMLHQWLAHVDMSNGAGYAVMVNNKGQLLMHGSTDLADITTPPGTESPHWNQPGTMLALTLEAPTQWGVASGYLDPVDHATYLGGYCRLSDFRDIPWAVIVQHRQDWALRPVDVLSRRMIWFGVGALGTVGVLIPGLWAWLLWTLRREELRADG